VACFRVNFTFNVYRRFGRTYCFHFVCGYKTQVTRPPDRYVQFTKLQDPSQETRQSSNSALIGFEPLLVDRPAHGQITYTDFCTPTPTVLLISSSDRIWNQSEHHTHIPTTRNYKILWPPVRNHNCTSVSAYIYKAVSIKWRSFLYLRGVGWYALSRTKLCHSECGSSTSDTSNSWYHPTRHKNPDGHDPTSAIIKNWKLNCVQVCNASTEINFLRQSCHVWM